MASIGAMRLRLLELSESDSEAKKLKNKDLLEDWEDVGGLLQYQGLLYVPEIIRSKVISCHYDDPLVGYFKIEKTRELVSRNYFWPTL